MAQLLQVTVPPGLLPGQTFEIMSPCGQKLAVAVPEGAMQGSTFQVQAPAAAAAFPAGQPQMVAPQMLMPQGMSGAPQAMGMGLAVGPQPVTDGFAMLKACSKVQLKEKVQMAEILVGWECANKYLIANELGQDLFIAAERSAGFLGAAGRQLLEGGQRPFNVDLGLLGPPGVSPTPFISFERPFVCECCCFNRPSMYVKNSSTGQLIGSIYDPFNCCQVTFQIMDSNGNEVLNVSAPACSCAMMCWGCPCCSEMVFEIQDSASGAVVGNITKRLGGAEMMGAMVGIGIDASNYVLDFGKVKHPEWKAMLIGLCLMLDFRWFTQGGQTQRDNSVLGQLMAAA